MTGEMIKRKRGQARNFLIISHLEPGGEAGVLLPNGSLSTVNRSEVIIREGLVESGAVKCVIGLPDRLFFNTGIPACIWILPGKEKPDRPVKHVSWKPLKNKMKKDIMQTWARKRKKRYNEL